MWVALGGLDPKTSPFHAHLEELFRWHVDVQWTTGRLNYINGYTTKAQDSLDFRLDNTSLSQGKHANWLTVYRLLCRTTVCIPVVILWFARAYPMVRSCRVCKCYAPIAWASGEKDNDTEKLYEHYLHQDGLERRSFLSYCRCYKIVKGELAEHFRPLRGE